MKNFLIIGLILLTVNSNLHCNVAGKDTLIHIMKECIFLNQNFINATKKEPQDIVQQNILRHKFEDYFEQSFLPETNNIIKEICATRSKEIIREYFSLCSNLRNCADEILSTVLFEVYMCQPDFFIEELLKLTVNDYNEIIKRSQGSFIMNTKGNEDQIKDYSLLKSRLFELQFH